MKILLKTEVKNMLNKHVLFFLIFYVLGYLFYLDNQASTQASTLASATKWRHQKRFSFVEHYDKFTRNISYDTHNSIVLTPRVWSRSDITSIPGVPEKVVIYFLKNL